MTPQPQASVIIPTLNSAPTLAIQLDSLLRQDYEGAFEILVIDNGSTDETRELLEDYYPRFAFRQVNLRYFISDRERNVCYARNVGIRYANSEKLLFCDADDMLSNNWVSQGIESLKEHQVVSGSGIYFLEGTFKTFGLWARLMKLSTRPQKPKPTLPLTLTGLSQSSWVAPLPPAAQR